jgi:TRAP-type C4-dicarboxylate transport system permease small subunit
LFEKALSEVTHRVSNLGQSVLMVMVLLVIVDIVLRRIFNSPLAWSLEVVEVMLVVVVFFSVAYCGTRRGHVSIDVLVSRFPHKARAIIDIFTYFFSIVLFGFMTWGGVVSAMDKWDAHRITGILPIPIYPFAFVVAFGSLLLALVLLAQLFYLVNNMVSK